MKERHCIKCGEDTWSSAFQHPSGELREVGVARIIIKQEKLRVVPLCPDCIKGLNNPTSYKGDRIMRGYKQEIKEMGCSGDFEKERLEEREEGGCLKCYLSDYCAGVFKEAEKARWDAKTPEERAAHKKLIRGLRELY